jgi:MinD-like ATPase involved in chromosome partitioning or flagellar assembly
VQTPTLTVVPRAPGAAALVATLARSPGGIGIARRFVDLADLLAAAAVGTARAALVGPDLRRLDRDAVARLRADGVAVIGVVGDADEAGDRHLRQLGVDAVVTSAAGADRLCAVVAAAVDVLARPRGTAPTGWGSSGPGAALADEATAEGPGVEAPRTADVDGYGVVVGSGRLIAVWGPTGAPGRTTLAVTLADELAAAGVPTLLADADTYGGTVAQMLGVLDEAPGLAGAARAANAGALDLPALAGFARQMPGLPLRLLTGIARADRWPELRPSALEVVWTLARSLAAVTVVDCGFCLEQDEELTFDTAAPQRNGATLATLAQADEVLAVGSADPVGIHRLVRGLSELREVAPTAEVRVVLAKVRRGPVGPSPEQQVRETLARFAGVGADLLVPADPDACDRAMLAGRSLREVAPDSVARRAIAGLAARWVVEHAPAPPPAARVPTRATPSPRRRLFAAR